MDEAVSTKTTTFNTKSYGKKKHCWLFVEDFKTMVIVQLSSTKNLDARFWEQKNVSFKVYAIAFLKKLTGLFKKEWS